MRRSRDMVKSLKIFSIVLMTFRFLLQNVNWSSVNFKSAIYVINILEECLFCNSRLSDFLEFKILFSFLSVFLIIGFINHSCYERLFRKFISSGLSFFLKDLACHIGMLTHAHSQRTTKITL